MNKVYTLDACFDYEGRETILVSKHKKIIENAVEVCESLQIKIREARDYHTALGARFKNELSVVYDAPEWAQGDNAITISAADEFLISEVFML